MCKEIYQLSALQCTCNIHSHILSEVNKGVGEEEASHVTRWDAMNEPTLKYVFLLFPSTTSLTENVTFLPYCCSGCGCLNSL